jgi:prepilin-type N-terminal cleavage/methylation domain-containing protein
VERNSQERSIFEPAFFARRRERAFTVLELLTAIAIIAVLASIAIRAGTTSSAGATASSSTRPSTSEPAPKQGA